MIWKRTITCLLKQDSLRFGIPLRYIIPSPTFHTHIESKRICIIIPVIAWHAHRKNNYKVADCGTEIEDLYKGLSRNLVCYYPSEFPEGKKPPHLGFPRTWSGIQPMLLRRV
jgi:hypothetical protein